MLLSAGLAEAAHSGAPAPTHLPDEVRIGILMPLAGDLALSGIQMIYAADLAVNDFNGYLAHEGIEWRLVPVSGDTGTDQVRALERVQALHAQGVDIMVGPAASAQLTYWNT